MTARPAWNHVLAALGSLLPARRRAARRLGRLVGPRREDALRSYPTLGLTPARMLALLHAADAGSPQSQFELFGEMLEKWPRLAAVENTRRLALTGLDWEVVPAAQAIAARAARAPRSAAVRRRAAPEAVADYCRGALERLDALRDVLDHLAAAIGYGVAVAELVWEDAQLVDLVPVPHGRLLSDANEPWRLRVLTDDEPTRGVALDEQPAKWIVHRPRAALGRHFDGGLLRASALLFLAQNLSLKDWLAYSQVAGVPVRVAQFDPGTPDATQEALLRMLTTLGADAAAVFSKSVDLRLVDAGGGGERPYRAIQEHCNTEVTILWLGQHLTTDLKGAGSRAAAEVHDRVREDLLVHDVADEGRTLRRDVLTPLVRARFGADAPPPLFRRSLVQAVDTRVLADVLAVAVNKLGLRVPALWAHRALGIPEAAGAEPTLAPTTGDTP